MKIKLIFICIFSIISAEVFSQQKDSANTSWKYEPNFMVGLDILNGGISVFSDRKLIQGFVSSRIKKNIHGIVELGYDSNVYLKNGYDAKANGFFIKPGVFYMFSLDNENPFNGFYGGGKLGFSLYNQEYKKIPVRGFEAVDAYQSFPASTQSSYWIEAVAGARVQLFKSKLYADVNAQPRYLVYTTKQDDIFPMVVPGFGKSSGKFSLGFSWNLAYQF